MSEYQRRTFTVTPIGVGRPDYSQNVELAVEREIRSHLYRYNWTIESTLATLVYPQAHTILLQFLDGAGNLLNYVPSDIKYLIYDIYVSGDYNALTLAGLYIFSYPAYALLETVAEVFGYGKASIELARGHPCVPGRAYTVALNQWSEHATFNGSFIVHGMSDEVVG